jgi:hypothetical protein
MVIDKDLLDHFDLSILIMKVIRLLSLGQTMIQILNRQLLVEMIIQNFS